MSTVKIVSDVKKISHNVNDVYGFFSDFRKIGKMVEMAAENPQVQEHIEAQTKKKFDFKDKVEQWETTENNCTFVIKGFGEAGLQFVEKEENKTLKLTGYGRSPFDFFLWIQFVEKDAYDTRIRITLHAELNAMMKMMLKKKLEKGINQLADGLTQIPYSAVNNL